VYISEESLYVERALHGAQSTAQPFLRGNAIVLLVLLGGRRSEDAVVGVGEGPDGGVGSRSCGNGTKLIANYHMSEVVHVEIVLVIAEGVLDFLTGNQETEEDESRYGCTRNCNPAQGLPDLEGKSQTVDDGDDPQMDGVREWDGRSQDTLDASQRVSEGEQAIQQSSGRGRVDRFPSLQSRDIGAQV